MRHTQAFTHDTSKTGQLEVSPRHKNWGDNSTDAATISVPYSTATYTQTIHVLFILTRATQQGTQRWAPSPCHRGPTVLSAGRGSATVTVLTILSNARSWPKANKVQSKESHKVSQKQHHSQPSQIIGRQPHDRKRHGPIAVMMP